MNKKFWRKWQMMSPVAMVTLNKTLENMLVAIYNNSKVVPWVVY